MTEDDCKQRGDFGGQAGSNPEDAKALLNFSDIIIDKTPDLSTIKGLEQHIINILERDIGVSDVEDLMPHQKSELLQILSDETGASIPDSSNINCTPRGLAEYFTLHSTYPQGEAEYTFA